MNKITDVFKFSLILIILIKLVLNSVTLSITNCCKFYGYRTPAIGHFFSYCNNKFFFNFWASTGFDTGYGFFAPNVASNFLIGHEIVHNDNRQEQKSVDYFLKSKEGKVRFSVLNQLFMDKIMPKDEQDTGSVDNEYMSVILKRLNNTVFRDTTVKMVTTTLYLYSYPKLEDFSKGTTYKLIPLEEHKKTRQ